MRAERDAPSGNATAQKGPLVKLHLQACHARAGQSIDPLRAMSDISPFEALVEATYNSKFTLPLLNFSRY
jgi:hypothetical protein